MSATVQTAFEIRPFQFDVPQEELDELRRRIDARRFVDEETVGDQSQGVQSATIQELARYWTTEYDWRKCEARLNALRQFLTEIEGPEHPFHRRSVEARRRVAAHHHARLAGLGHRAAVKIIEPLTDPTAHGGDAADAFYLVIASMPGYGFWASRRTPAGPRTASRY